MDRLVDRPRLRLDSTTVGALVISALATGLLVYVGARETVNYDSIWNVFIARQDHWTNLWLEVGGTPNPPLHHILLRVAASLFGSSPLAYRLISIAGIAAGVVLVASIVKRLAGSAPMALAAAAAFGFSSTALALALEVRAYALSLALMLAAFLLFLDWIATDAAEVPTWKRRLLVLIPSIALLTHYSAGLLLGGLGLTLGVLILCHARWRRRLLQEVRQYPMSAIAMIVVPLLVAMAAYAVHVKFWGRSRLNHVPEFLFDPASESVGEFLSRTMTALVALLFPQTPAPPPLPLIAAAGLLVALLVLAVRSTRRGETTGIATVLLTSMLALNVAAALAGRYPLGGPQRQQSFLFLFSIIAVFAALESARQLAPRRWAGAGAWMAVVAIAIGVNFASWVRPFQINTTPLFDAQMQAFHTRFGRTDALFADQYDFIFIFAQYHDATWRLRWEDEASGLRQVWEVTRGSERISVCRERDWQADLLKPSLYRDIADCLERSGTTRVGLLRLQQKPRAAPVVVADVSATAVRLASEEGLAVDPIVEANGNVFAAFERAGASSDGFASSPQPTR